MGGGALIEHPVYVLAILLAVLATLFTVNRTRAGNKFFSYLPLLVFAYFVPTALSNTGVIPLKSPLYGFIKDWLLPASLVLLTLSVDIPAILRLGPKVLVLFCSATASIVVGGPLAYLLVGLVWPGAIAGMGDQAWKGLAALSGSWIGGGANFVAIGESAGATDPRPSALMVVVDVAIANVWMAVLLWLRRSRRRRWTRRSAPIAGAIEELKTRRSSTFTPGRRRAPPTCPTC